MHTLLEVSGRKILRPNMNEMDFHRTKWLNLSNPKEKELEDLSNITKIPLGDIKTYVDPDEIPRVSEQENFTVIIFKSSGERRARKYDRATTSLAILISEKLIITMHRESVPSIEEALKLDEEQLHQLLNKGTGFVLYHLLEHIIHRYMLTSDEIEDEINRIEDTVFNNPDKKLVEKIFKLKRTLVYFQKGLMADRDVFTSFQKGFGEHIQEKVRPQITHLNYDVIQTLDLIATYRDILTGTLDIYMSSMNHQMNKVMKKMAAVGTIVLVPTFITGLYGMNFKIMPEIMWTYGYLFAWGLIIMSVVVLFWYFKKRDWF